MDLGDKELVGSCDGWRGNGNVGREIANWGFIMVGLLCASSLQLRFHLARFSSWIREAFLSRLMLIYRIREAGIFFVDSRNAGIRIWKINNL